MFHYQSTNSDHNFHDKSALQTMPSRIMNTFRSFTPPPPTAVSCRDLLAGAFALLRPFGYTNLQHNDIMQILSYSDENFPNEQNKNILELTPQFIHTFGRFNGKIPHYVIFHTTTTTMSHLSKRFLSSVYFYLFSFTGIFNACLKLDTTQHLQLCLNYSSKHVSS